MSTLAQYRGKMILANELTQVDDDLIGVMIMTFPNVSGWKGGRCRITNVIAGRTAFEVEAVNDGKRTRILRSEKIFLPNL